MIAGTLFVLSNVMAMVVAAGVAQTALRGREVWLRTFAALAAFPLVAMGALVVSDQLFHLGAGPVCGVLAVATRHAPEADRIWLAENAASAHVEYFDYDWTLNDTTRLR